MRKVKYKANYGYGGTDVEDELEYPDGARDEEIEEDIKEIVMQRVDWYWEPVNQDFTERRQYMDFYNCPYVVVIPFRNGNEYDEDYGCEATGKNCQCCQCKLTPEECEQLIQKQEISILENKK